MDLLTGEGYGKGPVFWVMAFSVLARLRCAIGRFVSAKAMLTISVSRHARCSWLCLASTQWHGSFTAVRGDSVFCCDSRPSYCVSRPNSETKDSNWPVSSDPPSSFGHLQKLSWLNWHQRNNPCMLDIEEFDWSEKLLETTKEAWAELEIVRNLTAWRLTVFQHWEVSSSADLQESKGHN